MGVRTPTRRSCTFCLRGLGVQEKLASCDCSRVFKIGNIFFYSPNVQKIFFTLDIMRNFFLYPFVPPETFLYPTRKFCVPTSGLHLHPFQGIVTLEWLATSGVGRIGWRRGHFFEEKSVRRGDPSLFFGRLEKNGKREGGTLISFLALRPRGGHVPPVPPP